MIVCPSVAWQVFRAYMGEQGGLEAEGRSLQGGLALIAEAGTGANATARAGGALGGAVR